MSTPRPPPVAAATAGPHDGERRKSLGKYVKRMSSVFKREKPGKGVPTLSSISSEPVASTPAPAPAPASAVEQQQSGVGTETETETETAITDPATQEAAQEQQPAQAESSSSVATPAAPDLALTLTPTTSIHVPAPAPAQPAAVLDRNAMQRERARALFAKYGLTLEPHEFIVTSAAGPLVPRVEKPIRMRVHRSCHQCGTLYGHDKVCVQCEHRRCKQCPRYPKKKTSSGEKKEKAAKEDPEQPRKKKLLTVTTRYGKELAYQPATQRVRRTCHKCDAFFVPATATTCESCNHVRCTKCPREPAKRNKWPAGYPGDADPESEDEADADAERAMEQFRRIWRKPRRIVRWECEQCHSLFRQGSHLCPGCGHERCDDCSRSPIKKPRSEESFDPAVVAAVEAKLRALGVGVDSADDAPSSGPEYR